MSSCTLYVFYNTLYGALWLLLLCVFSISGWSVASHVPHPQGFEISEEEGHFTVSYLAKQLEKTTGT